MCFPMHMIINQRKAALEEEEKIANNLLKVSFFLRMGLTDYEFKLDSQTIMATVFFLPQQ